MNENVVELWKLRHAPGNQNDESREWMVQCMKVHAEYRDVSNVPRHEYKDMGQTIWTSIVGLQSEIDPKLGLNAYVSKLLEHCGMKYLAIDVNPEAIDAERGWLLQGGVGYLPAAQASALRKTSNRTKINTDSFIRALAMAYFVRPELVDEMPNDAWKGFMNAAVKLIEDGPQ